MPPERERSPERRSTPISSRRTRARRPRSCCAQRHPHGYPRPARNHGVRQEVLGRAVLIGVGDLEWQPEPAARRRGRRPRARHRARHRRRRRGRCSVVGPARVVGHGRRHLHRRTRAGRGRQLPRIRGRGVAYLVAADRRHGMGITDRSYDLVSSQFMHLPSVQRSPYIQHCAAAVKPGGVLLVVGHHIHDLETTAGRPHLPDLFFSAEDVARELGAGWTIVAEDSRPRSTTTRSETHHHPRRRPRRPPRRLAQVESTASSTARWTASVDGRQERERHDDPGPRSTRQWANNVP